MKGDDSCCQSGENKNFKGSKCRCMEDLEEENKIVENEEESGCCGHCQH